MRTNKMARNDTSVHQALQPVTAQHPSILKINESPYPTHELTGASTDFFDLPSESCFANYPLQDILLQVGLGHTVRGSRSHLAALPSECLEHVAQYIRALFIQQLRDSGRATPVQEDCEEDRKMNVLARPVPRRTAKEMRPSVSLHDAHYASPPFAGGKQGCRKPLNFWDFAVPGERAGDLFPEM